MRSWSFEIVYKPLSISSKSVFLGDQCFRKNASPTSYELHTWNFRQIINNYVSNWVLSFLRIPLRF